MQNTSQVVSNMTQDFQASFPIHLWTYISLITNILGTLGNALTMTVLLIIKDLRKPNYILLRGVCTADFALNFFHIPFENIQSFYRFNTGRFLGSDHLCVWEEGCNAIWQASSVIGQMLIALNRFVAVFLPLIYRKYLTNRFTFLVWLLACVVFPIVYYYGGYTTWFTYGINENSGECINSPAVNINSFLLQFPSAYFPLFTSLSAYCAIFLRLLLTPGPNRSEIIQRSRGSGAMCICSFVFLLCVYPMLIATDTGFDRDVVNLHNAMWIKYLFRLSFAVNPIFYLSMDVRLRRGLVVLVRKHILHLPESQNTSNPVNTVQVVNAVAIQPFNNRQMMHINQETV